MRIIGIPENKADKQIVFFEPKGYEAWGDHNHHHYVCDLPKDGHLSLTEWLDGRYGIDPADYNWTIQLSPYNPAHTNYCFGDDDCCGIFNALNDDLEVICNECGMKLTDLTEDIYGVPLGNKDEYTLINFLKMCTESLPPDEFELIFEASQKTMALLAQTRKQLINFNLCKYCQKDFGSCKFIERQFGKGKGKDNVIACDNVKLIL